MISAIGALKQVHGPGDVPAEEHYQIAVFKQHARYVEGDERSRTSPGHGYPAHTEMFETPEIYVTTDLAAVETFLAALLKEAPGRRDVSVCLCTPRAFTHSVRVAVS